MPLGHDIDGLNLVFRQAFMGMKEVADAKIAESPNIGEPERSFLIMGAIREAVVQTILANNREIESQLRTWRWAPADEWVTTGDLGNQIPY